MPEPKCKDKISDYLTHHVDSERRVIRTVFDPKLTTEFYYTDDIDETIEKVHDEHVREILKAWFEEADWDA